MANLGLKGKDVDQMTDKEVEKKFNEIIGATGKKVKGKKASSDEVIDGILKKDTDKITESDVKDIMEAIASTDTEEIKNVLNMPSNNGIVDGDGSVPSEDVKADVTVNTNTGLLNAVPNISPEEAKIDNEMAKLLDVDPEDLYKMPESINDVDFEKEDVVNNMESLGIGEANFEAMIEIVEKYRKANASDKASTNWYNLLPEAIQILIKKQCASINNTDRGVRKIFAIELIEQLIRESGIDRMTIDLQNSMAKAFDISEIISMTLDSQKTSFETGMDKVLDDLHNALEATDVQELKDEILEKIDTTNKVKAAFIDSYELKSLNDLISRHKLRIKKIDFDRYGRHCDSLLRKYKGDTPYVIHDIRKCVPVLSRALPDYSTNQIVAYIIAFIKSTMNMKSNDVVDSVYISYFISNIINIDFVNDKEAESAKFVKVFLDNVSKGIDMLSEQI